MPLVANNNLPSFEKLKEDGKNVISIEQALHQDIRELHIGLLNMMPDAALEATERQFFRLVGESNQIAQFYFHPFTLKEIKRSAEATSHINKYYKNFDEIKGQGLDALIITGANMTGTELSCQPFWEPLKKILAWSYDNVTSTLCSCLATHAVLEFRYKQKRYKIPTGKRWGIYQHYVIDKNHPFVTGVNTCFDVPHSRFNEISLQQFRDAKLKTLVVSELGDVHLATSEDGFRLVFFQGHPEYDINSLLKEYKREIKSFYNGNISLYPPIPENYFSKKCQNLLEEYQDKLIFAMNKGKKMPEFPEKIVISCLDNTWNDTAEAIISKWIGKVYQLTNTNKHIPFKDGVDPKNPLNLK